MKLATLFLIVYSGAAQAIARPVGVEATSAVGDVVAIGFRAPSVGGGHPFRRRWPQIPVAPPLSIGARAYPRGVLASTTLGRPTAVGGARIVAAGFRANLRTARIVASGAARTLPAGLLGGITVAEARAAGSARVRVAGFPVNGRSGEVCGRPTADETAWIALQREIVEEDDLLLLGAFDA